MSSMLDRIVNGGSSFAIEQSIRFASQRQSLIAENVANFSVPGYRHKDLDIEKFQSSLSKRIDQRRAGQVPHGNLANKPIEPGDTLVFHDGNDRSIEQSMMDQTKNGLMHNLMVELLRRQHEQIKTALRDRIS